MPQLRHRLHLIPVNSVVPRSSLLFHPFSRTRAHLGDPLPSCLVQRSRRFPELAGVFRSNLDAPPQDASPVDAIHANTLPTPRRTSGKSSPSPKTTGAPSSPRRSHVAAAVPFLPVSLEAFLGRVMLAALRFLSQTV